MPRNAKSRAREVRDSINAAMKKDVLTFASDKQFVVEYAPTGLLPFDILLGGGLPRGRFTVCVGDWSTLKSYVGLSAIANEQKRGGVCALIDTEHAFDPSWAESIGVNLAELIIPPRDAETGEQAIDYAEQLIRNGCDLIVFDSVAAALPQAERERRLSGESQQMARLATLMSRAMRKLTAANSRTAVFWINQIRMNVGITFGNPETPTGGKALPYFSSLTIETKKIGKVTRAVKMHDGDKETSGKEVIAQKFKATLTKSKLSKPLRDVLFDWSYEDGGGIDTVKFLLAQGVEHGAVIKRGNTWSVAGSRNNVRGHEAFLKHLASNPRDRAHLERAVLAAHGLEHLGHREPASRKVVVRKSSRPSAGERSSTRTVVRGASKAMRPVKKLSKSTRTR